MIDYFKPPAKLTEISKAEQLVQYRDGDGELACIISSREVIFAAANKGSSSYGVTIDCSPGLSSEITNQQKTGSGQESLNLSKEDYDYLVKNLEDGKEFFYITEELIPGSKLSGNIIYKFAVSVRTLKGSNGQLYERIYIFRPITQNASFPVIDKPKTIQARKDYEAKQSKV